MTKREKRFDHKNIQREDDHVMGEGQVEGMPENDRDSNRYPKPGSLRDNSFLESSEKKNSSFNTLMFVFAVYRTLRKCVCVATKLPNL